MKIIGTSVPYSHVTGIIPQEVTFPETQGGLHPQGRGAMAMKCSQLLSLTIVLGMMSCTSLQPENGGPGSNGEPSSGSTGPSTDGTGGSEKKPYEPPEFECSLTHQDQTELVTNDAGVQTLVGVPQQTSILFVFDMSGSMGDQWGIDRKWRAASRALLDAVETSHELLQGNLRVGGILFPQPRACLVDSYNSGDQMTIRSAETFLEDWEDFMSTQFPRGSTPLGEAFRVADRALVDLCGEGALDHLYKILVLTDGMPNCDKDKNAWTEFPARWRAKGIKTYVFGLPGSQNAREVLNDIAEAGGTGEYIAPVQELPDGGVIETDAGGLSDELAAVVC